MSEHRGWLTRRRAGLADTAIFAGLFVAYLVALLVTARTLGYARDEGFYFHAAGTYGRWLEILLASPAKAFQASTVDRYWQENHEHPSLMKSLFALSQRFFEGVLFQERGTAYRFPASAEALVRVHRWIQHGHRVQQCR